MAQGSWVKIYACRCREEQRPAKPRGCLSVFSSWTPVPDSPPMRQYIPELCPSCYRLADLRMRYGLVDNSPRRQREHRHEEDMAASAVPTVPAVPAVPAVRPPPSAVTTAGTGPRRPLVHVQRPQQRRQTEPGPGRVRGAGPPPPAPSRPSLPHTPNKLQKRSNSSGSSNSSSSSKSATASRAKVTAAKSGLRVDTTPRRQRLSARVLGVLSPRAMESDESFVCRDARRIESGL